MLRAQSNGAAAPRPFASVPAIALALTAIAVVPLLAVAITFAVMLNERERSALQAEIRQVTQQLAAKANRELANTITLLETLASSPELDGDDLRLFHELAGRIKRDRPNLERIRLIDVASRATVLDTRYPFGVGRPVVDPSTVETVLRIGRPAVMPQIVAGERGRRLIGVRVPVWRGGAIKYVLTGLFGFDELRALVRDPSIPSDWIVGLIDSDGTILARSRDEERYLGHPASSPLRQAARAQTSGLLRAPTLEGAEVQTAFQRLGLAEWTVAVGMPAALADWPLRRFPMLLIAGIAGGVIVAALLTALLSRRFLAQHRLVKQLSASVAEKDVLLGEVHHRVRNNLHLISTLVSLRQRGASSDASQQLEEIKHRIMAMGELYNHLYTSLEFGSIRLDELLGAIVRSVADSFAPKSPNVRLHLDLAPLPIDAMNAVPLSLMVVELVSNAYKHAFPANAPGSITVRLRRDGSNGVLEVIDNGTGAVAATAHPSGLRIVDALAGQIDGRFELVPGPGTRARVGFPLKDAAAIDEGRNRAA